jgi:hypothetical protein
MGLAAEPGADDGLTSRRGKNLNSRKKTQKTQKGIVNLNYACIRLRSRRPQGIINGESYGGRATNGRKDTKKSIPTQRH